ncbi:MAG TPA: oligoribonuclease [Candidatus Saccharimonadales bacterium]|nr:oligoribonuclease [Candidatus Saccharimonadales bacterium]
MTDLKKVTPTKLLWIDLEMTGLNPQKDRIVEVAAIVTDWDFNELDRFESGVGQNEQEIKGLFAANPWASARPESTKELIDLSLASQPEKEIEAKVRALMDEHLSGDEVMLLAGNSIHQDRAFIRHWWPLVNERLHYRMLDVSAWKVVMQAKYGLEFPKKETHRALDDILESIDELKFYLGKVNG